MTSRQHALARTIVSAGLAFAIHHLFDSSLQTTIAICATVFLSSFLLRISFLRAAVDTVWGSVKTAVGFDRSLPTIALWFVTGQWLPIPSARRLKEFRDAINGLVETVEHLRTKFKEFRGTEEWRYVVGVSRALCILVAWRWAAGKVLQMPFSANWSNFTNGPGEGLWGKFSEQILWERHVKPEFLLEMCLDLAIVWFAWRIGVERRSRWILRVQLIAFIGILIGGVLYSVPELAIRQKLQDWDHALAARVSRHRLGTPDSAPSMNPSQERPDAEGSQHPGSSPVQSPGVRRSDRRPPPTRKPQNRDAAGDR